MVQLGHRRLHGGEMILDPAIHAACIHGLRIVLECYGLFCLSIVTLGLLLAGRYILPAMWQMIWRRK